MDYSRKLAFLYELTKKVLLSETDMPLQRPISERHSSSKVHIPDWRPIEDQYASPETDMPV